MKRNYFLLIILLFVTKSSYAEGIAVSDSLSPVKKTPPLRFLSFTGMGGTVLPTNDYIREGNRIPWYSAVSFKFGTYSTGDSWEDFAYGMPYNGIGIYTVKFFNKKALGVPVSLYLFQGGNWKRFNSNWSLKYEFNLGMSFNWKPYDIFDNPDNIALGSASNVHVGANIYMKGRLNNRWDLHMGVGAAHFSNGAQRLPNKGVNLLSPFVELVYNFNTEAVDYSKRAGFTPPPLEKCIDYDVLFTVTSRQIRVDTAGTGLPQRILDKNFKVFGLSYATLFVNSYNYKWGPSIEMVYDESSGVKVWRQIHPQDGQYYDRVKPGPIYKRFSVGLSLKGEMTYRRVSFFANMGYNLLHGNTYDYRVYQIIGAKVYLKDNIFGAFGIRAGKFSKAQYLYWSIGYTIKGTPLTKKDRYINHILP
ncbi:MAG: hypothetical protein LBS04_01930 [Tannerellaceae bacterium]|jgi:hypothetical protein|nr:hypothetical protein [Tannerellaceae bacterium]